MKVIINADDCGIDIRHDSHIREMIENGKISSTTIMANMDDFEGALHLYEEYHSDISFGVHLNLTEGAALLNNDVLIEYGLCTMKEGKMYFVRHQPNSKRYKYLPYKVKEAIYREFSAQIEKIQSYGVQLSHIDSHHHIHTSPNLISVMAQISKDFNIPKMRRMRNYVPHGTSFYGRQLWVFLSKLHNRNYKFTNYFGSALEYFEKPNLFSLGTGDTIELMCHPGNQGEQCMDEEKLLKELSFPRDMEIITYNEL